MSREVITVQCGHYSNFIGTHWWNLQEASYSCDGASRELLYGCTFREGLTPTTSLGNPAPQKEGKEGKGKALFLFLFGAGYPRLHPDTHAINAFTLATQGQETFTPRLIAVDLPGSLKTLRVSGVLYGTAADDKAGPWEGGVELHKTESPKKNQFLADLDRIDSQQPGAPQSPMPPDSSAVEVWSDYLRLHLHPKSLLTVPGHFHNDPHSSFDPYPAGLEAWQNKKFREELENKIHFFVEECDSLQGFQLLVDWAGGFSALGSCLAEELSDEFPSKSLLAVLASPLPVPLDKTAFFSTGILNHALAMDALSSHSSLLCPLSTCHNPWRSSSTTALIPGLPGYQPTLAYHSSAVMATALDTVSLLYRTDHSPLSLPSICDNISARGRKVCSVSLRLPFSLPEQSSLIAELDSAPLPSSLHHLTPFSTAEDVRWTQALALRGVPPTYPLCQPSDPHSFRHPSHALASHLTQHSPSINSLFCTVEKPFPLDPPFPVILPQEYYTTRQAAVCGSLQTQSGSHHLLSSLAQETKATNTRRYPTFSSVLDTDSTAELLHRLSSLAECYQTCPAPEPTWDSD